MGKNWKVLVILIGFILLANGVLNIWDDARVLTYDLTSVFSGLGFIILGIFLKSNQ